MNDQLKETREIYCCGCQKEVEARLTTGFEIYPHRTDLSDLPFWRCDECSNYVGCHHKTANRTRPLGCIPTPEVRQARKKVHQLMDPLWKRRKIKRKVLYQRLSDELGAEYHTSEIRSVDEANRVCRVLQQITREYGGG